MVIFVANVREMAEMVKDQILNIDYRAPDFFTLSLRRPDSETLPDIGLSLIVIPAQ